jgi:SAM-dependent methyltransferase
MIKSIVKKLIPSSLMQWRRRKIVAKGQKKFADKTLAETFAEIYDKNIWGGEMGEFYSGEGSTQRYSQKYAQTITKFISENNIKRVVDLGCGDFRVASKFVAGDFYYTGCDVVPSLVEHLNRNFANEKNEFRCLNIVEDELPDGDLCLIRQVLQHLSNAEIEKILLKARKYKYLIITEHYPHPNTVAVPNLDIPHGPDMRLHFDSAVYLDKPPFNLENIKLLLDVEAEEGTRIKTFVVKNLSNDE